LLELRRAALRDYLRGLGQEWREDATNRDTKRQRARIRENLLPVLERNFSPRAAEHLAKLATLSAEEGSFWAALIEDRFETLATRRGDAVSIPIVKLLSPLELAVPGGGRRGEPLRCLTERLVRRLYQHVQGNLLELTSVHVDHVIRLAEAAVGGKRVELPGGMLAARNFGELTFSREERARTRNSRKETQSGAHAYQYSIRLDACGATDVSVPELGACFRLKVIDWPSAERETTMWGSILDLDTLRPPLVLRSWQPGDGYRPRGRRKTRKLKEMLLAARVAANDRRGWPVLESGGQVVWARGMEPAEGFCAREGTRAGVLIEERKL
jgi:tRNA(Ile)-lysidine synthase